MLVHGMSGDVQGLAGCCDEFVGGGAGGRGASGHVGLAAALASGDGGEGLDEFACLRSFREGAFAAVGAEVEGAAIVHDEEGGSGVLAFFESVEEFGEEFVAPSARVTMLSAASRSFSRASAWLAAAAACAFLRRFSASSAACFMASK